MVLVEWLEVRDKIPRSVVSYLSVVVLELVLLMLLVAVAVAVAVGDPLPQELLVRDIRVVVIVPVDGLGEVAVALVVPDNLRQGVVAVPVAAMAAQE